MSGTNDVVKPDDVASTVPEEGESVKSGSEGQSTGGRRKRGNGSRKNSWLAHVKATMKVNRNMSFKQVLKRAKKTYKKSKSQSQSQSSQSGGRRRRVKKGGNAHAQDLFQAPQNGGSGMAGKPAFGSTAESL
jgi:hypothetical protein